MAGIQSEHARDVREALRSVASDPDLGPATLSDAAALSNLLKDLLPDAPREKNLLVAAADARLAAMMLDHVDQGIDARSAIKLAAASFGTNTLYSDDVCHWVASELAIALGLAPELAGERTELPAVDIDPPADARAAAEPAAAESASPTAPTPVPVGRSAPDSFPAAPTTAASALTAAAATQVGAELGPADGFATNEATAPEGAESRIEVSRPRRLSMSALPVLAGVIVALPGYALPVIHVRSYYGDQRIFGLTPHVIQGGVVSLALAAVCAAIIGFGPRRRAWLMAAGAGACAAGLLMGYTFWHIRAHWVVAFGDAIRPGLIAGLIGAALLAAGGAIGFSISLAWSKPAGSAVSPGPH